MELLADLAFGFQTALSVENLIYCFVGVFLGTMIGVLPGVGSLAAIAMLLPITYYLDPTTAIIMLAGVYYGAEYGGSTASILLNLPGTPSNAVTCLDGYPMAQKGKAGVALMTTTIASFVGGTFGILMLTFLSPVVVDIALMMRPADYLILMLFGLLAAATVAPGSAVKGVSMAILGLLLGCVGLDVNSGMPRFTFGLADLYDGISVVVLAMGLFGIAEIITSVRTQTKAYKQKVSLRSMLPSRSEARRSLFPMARGAGIGGIFGPLPATGPSIAAFVSYAIEKRISKHPETFGTGAIEGIASPEASNNSAVQTAFIPTLTLGIPGTPAMAIILGALMIHGITPGPSIVERNPDLFWGLIASFWIGNILLLVLNIPLVGIWVRLLNVPYRYLYPLIVGLICVGAYSIGYNSFDVLGVAAFGLIGYQMRRLGFQPAPLLMGFILGPMVEENLRRALLLSRGDFAPIVLRPMSYAFIAIIVIYGVWTLWARRRARVEMTQDRQIADTQT
ncbi:tripartite tricarboxylate transporter permease [Pelagibacterium sp.]|uniref:tripartite tricarboxylate transporter permease n=1 Tax=Pelagibacterium sp. TaxID=1967288 RepID=UPI003A905BC6